MMKSIFKVELNFLRALLFYNFKIKKLPYTPLITAIEITNNCNYRCRFCPMNTKNSSILTKIDRDKRNIKLDELEFLIKKYKKYFHPRINLSFHGESFIHPEFPEIIGLLKKYKITYSITTNGSLFSGKNFDAVVDYQPKYMMFSLYTLDKNKYRSFTGGKLDITLKNISNFLKIKSRKTNVAIRTMNMPLFKDEKVRLKRKFGKYPKLEFVYGVLNSWAGRVDISKYDKDLGKHCVAGTKYCIQPWLKVDIGSNLDVYVCNNDDDKGIGNLKKDSLFSIWNSKGYISLRKNLLKGELEKNKLCNGCDTFDYTYAVDKPNPLFFNSSFIRLINTALGLNKNKDFTLRKK